MSSCGASVCLLVVLGIVLASGRSDDYISENMKSTQKLIADELGLKEADVGSSQLFSSVINSINTSCQRKDDIQVMNATLDVYMRIFSSILRRGHHQHHSGTHRAGLLDQLSNTKRSEVESAVMTLQRRMEELRNHLNCHLNSSREELLNGISKIQVHNPDVQKKALAEFLEIYQAASAVSQSC